MTRPDSHYEPPAAEEMSTRDGPASTAAGITDVYGAITLLEDDDKRSGE